MKIIFTALTLLPLLALANPEIDENGWCHYPKNPNDPNNEVKVNGKCGYIDQAGGGGGAGGSSYWKIENITLTRPLANRLSTGQEKRSHKMTSNDAPNIACELNTVDGTQYLSNDWTVSIEFDPKSTKPADQDTYFGVRGDLTFELSCYTGARQ